MIYDLVLVSRVLQSDSVIHVYIYTHICMHILLQILSSFTLLQNIEQRPLCYTVGPCWLPILHIVVYICQSQILNLSLPDAFCNVRTQFSPIPFVFWNLFIFNWRIIDLQHCAGFRHTSTRISRKHMYVPSLLHLPPNSNLHPTPLHCR